MTTAMTNHEEEIRYTGLNGECKLDIREQSLVFMFPTLEFDCVPVISISGAIDRAVESFIPTIQEHLKEVGGIEGEFELHHDDLREGPLEVSLMLYEELSKDNETTEMLISGCVSYCTDSPNGFSVLDFTLDLQNNRIEFLAAEIDRLKDLLTPYLESLISFVWNRLIPNEIEKDELSFFPGL